MLRRVKPGDKDYLGTVALISKAFYAAVELLTVPREIDTSISPGRKLASGIVKNKWS